MMRSSILREFLREIIKYFSVWKYCGFREESHCRFQGGLLLIFNGKFMLSLEIAIAVCIVYRRKTLNSIAFEWEKIDERK